MSAREDGREFTKGVIDAAGGLFAAFVLASLLFFGLAVGLVLFEAWQESRKPAAPAAPAEIEAVGKD